MNSWLYMASFLDPPLSPNPYAQRSRPASPPSEAPSPRSSRFAEHLSEEDVGRRYKDSDEVRLIEAESSIDGVTKKQSKSQRKTTSETRSEHRRKTAEASSLQSLPILAKRPSTPMPRPAFEYPRKAPPVPGPSRSGPSLGAENQREATGPSPRGPGDQTQYAQISQSNQAAPWRTPSAQKPPVQPQPPKENHIESFPPYELDALPKPSSHHPVSHPLGPHANDRPTSANPETSQTDENKLVSEPAEVHFSPVHNSKRTVRRYTNSQGRVQRHLSYRRNSFGADEDWGAESSSRGRVRTRADQSDTKRFGCLFHEAPSPSPPPPPPPTPAPPPLPAEAAEEEAGNGDGKGNDDTDAGSWYEWRDGAPRKRGRRWHLGSRSWHLWPGHWRKHENDKGRPSPGHICADMVKRAWRKLTGRGERGKNKKHPYDDDADYMLELQNLADKSTQVSEPIVALASKTIDGDGVKDRDEEEGDDVRLRSRASGKDVVPEWGEGESSRTGGHLP